MFSSSLTLFYKFWSAIMLCITFAVHSLHTVDCRPWVPLLLRWRQALSLWYHFLQHLAK